MNTKEIIGVVFWWSTFYQRWNVTPYKKDPEGEHEREKTRVFRGKSIFSDDRLLKLVTEEGMRVSEEKGIAKVVEPAYYAIWARDKSYVEFLTNQQTRLVCNEV